MQISNGAFTIVFTLHYKTKDSGGKHLDYLNSGSSI